MSENEYEWKTAITTVEPGKIIIRGYRVEDLMENLSFGEAAYLLYRGKIPPKNHGKLMNAILVALIDYGIGAPSVAATRFAASTGLSLGASAGAGLIAFGGRYHGGSIELCAKMLRDGVERMKSERQTSVQIAETIVKEYRACGKRIPGWGHPVHRIKDPRTEKLFELAERHNVNGDHLALCKAVESAIEKILGRHLTTNAGAAIAALALDMGFDWKMVHGLNSMSRSAGLTAHAHEEIERERPFRATKTERILYDGQPEREFKRPE